MSLDIARKESINTTLINYVGVCIGLLSTVFVYPQDLSLYGAYGFLTNTASLMVPFISLGFGAVLIKYFPNYRQDQASRDNFFSAVLMHYIIGILFFGILFFATFYYVKSAFLKDDITFQNFYIYLFPLTILYVLYELLSNYCINFFKISYPSFLTSLMKIYLPGIFVLCIFGYASRNFFPILICFFYFTIILLLYNYLKKNNQVNFSLGRDWSDHIQTKAIYRFALYSILGGTGSVLALRIDALMVTKMVGTEMNGIYSLAFFISNASYIPAAAISSIYDPKIAQLSFEQNLEKLQTSYQRSARIMSIPSIWIITCILLGMPLLIHIMPHSEKIIAMIPALGFLLISRLVDAITGINHYILSYSKYYKWEAWMMIGMAGVNVGLNYFFIPMYGIKGAAIATCISVCIFNLVKCGLLWYKLKLHPLSKNLIVIIGLGIIYFLIINNIDFCDSIIVNCVLKILCFTSFFAASIYYSKMCIEYNDYLMVKYRQLSRKKIIS